MRTVHLLILLAACEAPSPTLLPPTHEAPAPGADGVARFAVGDEIVALSWVERDGRALTEGDIDLGPAAALRARGTVVSALGEVWPNGEVPYRFVGGLAAPDTDDERALRDTVIAAMQTWEAEVGVDFIHDPNGARPTAIRIEPIDDMNASGSSPVGFGHADHTVKLNLGDATLRTALHELGHTLGLWHEHTRPDRDDYIVYHEECVEVTAESDPRHNFTRHTTGAFAHGPFDFDSVMLYSSLAFSVDDPPSCYTLTRLNGTPFSAPQDLSEGDIAAVRALYQGFADSSADDEGLGEAVAVGDFNGDGRDDVVSGAPRERAGLWASGSVFVWLSSDDASLMPWQRLDQTDLDSDEQGDAFGAALAVADFDRDGYDDLAVGAPGEGSIGVSGHGAVYLFRGTAWGLVADLRITQSSLGYETDEPGDNFGEALEVGYFTGSLWPDLAIGAPGETRNNSQNVAQAGAGQVAVLDGSSTGLVFYRQLTASIPKAGERFGTALAAADFDASLREDLAVGVPWRDGAANFVDRGAVDVFYASTTGFLSASTLALPTTATPDAGAWFGYALDAGLINNDARADLVIGAPGRNDYGAVYVYQSRQATPTAPWRLTWTGYLNQSGMGSNETGDNFGTSVRLGNLSRGDTHPDLVVGADGEAPGADPASGAIFLLRGSTTGTFSAWGWLDQTGLGTNEGGDRLGAALAIGDIDGSSSMTEVIVGAPGEAAFGGPMGGAVFVYHADPPALPPVPGIGMTVLTQD